MGEISEFRKKLENLYEELTHTVQRADEFSREVKHYRDIYTEEHDIIPSARKVLGMKRSSVKGLVDFWMPLWKEEGRISENGKEICLGVEAQLLGLEKDEIVDIYRLYRKMLKLLVR